MARMADYPDSVDIKWILLDIDSYIDSALLYIDFILLDMMTALDVIFILDWRGPCDGKGRGGNAVLPQNIYVLEAVPTCRAHEFW
jgi:hypothetical protein